MTTLTKALIGGLVPDAYLFLFIYLFIQYFKRVALLAKLASLPSGPQQTKTILHINTIYNMYMDTSEFKRVKDAIKHITNVFCKIIRNKSKDAMSKTLKYKFKI